MINECCALPKVCISPMSIKSRSLFHVRFVTETQRDCADVASTSRRVICSRDSAPEAVDVLVELGVVKVVVVDVAVVVR